MQLLVLYVSLGLAAASFLLFCVLSRRVTKPLRDASFGPGVQQNPMDAKPQGGGVPSTKEIGDLAEALGKAGPIGTSAALSVTFLLIAMATAGVIELSVGGSEMSDTNAIMSLG